VVGSVGEGIARLASARYLRDHGSLSAARAITAFGTESGMAPESNGRAVSESRIQIFISHSRQDAKLAAKLIRRLEADIDIPEGAIRCTSVSGSDLEPGDTIDAKLHRNLQECSVVIALLTHESLVSSYVLIELGAAWMLGKEAYPLLAPGLSSEDLPGPFESIQAVQLSDDDAMLRLLTKVASAAGLPLRGEHPDKAKAHADFAKYVKRLPSWGRRCLLAGIPFGVAAAVSAAIFGYAVHRFSRSDVPYAVHLLTGNKGGSFYSLGLWLRDDIESQRVPGAEPTLDETDGSVDNCARIELAEANAVALAWTSRQCGESKEYPRRKARVLAALYPEALQFLVHKNSDTPGALPNLRGKRVYFGNPRSGTRVSARLLLAKAEYNSAEIDDLISSNSQLGEMDFEPAADRLRKGEIDAAFFATGFAAKAVKLALQDGTVRLVSLPPALIQKMLQDDDNSHFAYASLGRDDGLKKAYDPNPYGLNGSGYRGSNGAANTPPFQFDSIASDVVLLATESVDKEFVELLLNTLYDGSKWNELVKLGVSRTYLEQSALLNERMTEKGIRLNTGVRDYHAWWSPKVKVRRILYFSGGVMLIFFVVTFLVALLRFIRLRVRLSARNEHFVPTLGRRERA
jgi:TRAP transporter TAXI family solute receptor